jgi:hypothetical protein
MALVLFRNPLLFYTLTLLLFLPLNRPLLGEVHFMDSGTFLHSHSFVPCSHNADFFQHNFLPWELSFFPIYFWVEFSQPWVPENYAVLSQVGHIELLCDLLLPSLNLKHTRFANNPLLVFSSIHIVYFSWLPQFFGVESPLHSHLIVNEILCCSAVDEGLSYNHCTLTCKCNRYFQGIYCASVHSIQVHCSYPGCSGRAS